MEINIECSAIFNDEFSQFMDANSQINLNEESLIVTPSVQIAPEEHQCQVPELIKAVTEPPNEANRESLPVGEEVKMKGLNQQELEEPVLEKPQQPAQSTAWEKVQISKRRNTNVTSIIKDSNQSSLGAKPTFIKSNTFNLKNLQSKQVQEYQPAQCPNAVNRTETIKKKLSERAVEPLPVFDCLFCCQEHFVLQKINEKALSDKYCKNYTQDLTMADLFASLPGQYSRKKDLQGPHSGFEQRNLPQQEQKYIMKPLGQLIETLRKHSHGESSLKHKPKLSRRVTPRSKPIQSINQDNARRPEDRVRQLNDDQKMLNNVNLVGSQKLDYSVHDRQNLANHQKKQAGLAFPLLGEILDQTLNDTNLCINTRNRRQKVLENISFDSEAHNIYDPYFTSEEELDTMQDGSELSECSLNDESLCESSIEEEESIAEESENAGSLSSIERQEDDDDFGESSSDEEEKKQEDSERLTFGCVTQPIEEEQKVTFSNCDEASLSPVRDIKNFTQPQTQGFSENSACNKQDVFMLDQSPISHEKVLEQVDGSQLNSGYPLKDIRTQRKIDFYPTQVADNSGPSQSQQPSNDFQMENILSQISKQHEGPQTAQILSSETSEEDDGGSEFELTQTVKLGHQTNTEEFPNLSNRHEFEQMMSQPSSHSFTNTDKTLNHQKLIGSNPHSQSKLPGQEAKSAGKISKTILTNPIMNEQFFKKYQHAKLKVANSQNYISFDNIAKSIQQQQAKQLLQNKHLTQGMITPQQNNHVSRTGSNDKCQKSIEGPLVVLSHRQGVQTTFRGSQQQRSQNFSDNSDYQLKNDKLQMTAHLPVTEPRSVKATKNNSTIPSQVYYDQIEPRQKKSNILFKLKDPKQITVSQELPFDKTNHLHQVQSNKAIKLSKKELDNFRTALCSTRYSTQSGVLGVTAGLQTFQDEPTKIQKKPKKALKGKKKLVKPKEHKRNYSKTSHHTSLATEKPISTKSHSKQINSRQKSLINQQQSDYMPADQLQQYLHSAKVNNFVGEPAQFGWTNTQAPSKQHQSNASVGALNNHQYMSIQDNKNIFYPQFPADEDTQTIKNSATQNAASKKRPQKLNGSIEEMQLVNFLNSIDTKSGCSKDVTRGSISMTRGLNQASTSLSRQGPAVDYTQNQNSNSNGQFSFSQSSLKLNLTSSLAKPKHPSKKKKKQTLGNTMIQANTTSSSSTFKNTSHYNRKRVKNAQRTRSNSKNPQNQPTQSIPSSHQLLMTQQPGLEQQQLMVLKNQQILLRNQPKTINTKQIKEKKKLKKLLMLSDNNTNHQESRSHSRVGLVKETAPSKLMKQGHGQHVQSNGKFMMSQVTSPLRALAQGNHSNNAFHQPHQSSVILKDPIDLKKSLANEILNGYLKFQNKNANPQGAAQKEKLNKKI